MIAVIRGTVASLLSILTISLLLFGGCGCGSKPSTPEETVSRIIEALKTGKADEAKALFIRPEFYTMLTESVPQGTELRAGQVNYSDASNATIEIYFGQQGDAPGIVLLMANTGGGWKVFQVIQQ